MGNGWTRTGDLRDQVSRPSKESGTVEIAALYPLSYAPKLLSYLKSHQIAIRNNDIQGFDCGKHNIWYYRFSKHNRGWNAARSDKMLHTTTVISVTDDG